MNKLSQPVVVSFLMIVISGMLYFILPGNGKNNYKETWQKITDISKSDTTREMKKPSIDDPSIAELNKSHELNSLKQKEIDSLKHISELNEKSKLQQNLEFETLQKQVGKLTKQLNKQSVETEQAEVTSDKKQTDKVHLEADTNKSVDIKVPSNKDTTEHSPTIRQDTVSPHNDSLPNKKENTGKYPSVPLSGNIKIKHKDGIPLRLEPSNLAEIIINLENGTSCTVLERTNSTYSLNLIKKGKVTDYWYKVAVNGKRGWIYGYYTDNKN